MSNLFLEVGVYGGVNIEAACHDACWMATRFGITIHFTFQDVKCMAIPGGSSKVLIENWHEAVKSQSRYPMASTHPRSADSASPVTTEKP